MNKLKIFCVGAENHKNQVHHLRTAFKELGHEVLDNYKVCDAIFCNDPSSYSEEYRKNNKGAIIIYNLLDYPPHLIDPNKYDLSMYSKLSHNWGRNFDVEGLTNKLKTADLVTTICDHVTWQAQHFSKIKAHTIFNPIKPVSKLNLPPYQKIRNSRGEPYKYLAVGRLRDINKRMLMILPILQFLGESHSSLVTAGSEDLGIGEFLGDVSDFNLNLLYNSVDYLFLLSAFRSIGLPALEAIVTGVIPIVCNDCPTTKEFFGDIGVPPEPKEIANCIKSPEWNAKARKFVDEHCEEYKAKFSPQQICKNILNLL